MANGDVHNPLNADSLTKLNQVLAMVPQTQQLIEKCKRAGIDTGQAEQENTNAGQLAAAIKKEFFPGEP